MTESNKPIEQFRAGSVSASVFKNISKNDDKNEWYSITIQRVYNAGTNESPDLKNTSSFNERDLPDVDLVTRQAYAFCRTNKLNRE